MALASLGAALAIGSSPASALSPAAHEAYVKLLTSLREEVRTKPVGEGILDKKKLLDSIQQAADWQPDQLERDIARVDIYFESDAAKSAAAVLKTLLEKDDRAKDEQDLQAMKERLQRIKDVVLAAQVPADLDALSEEMVAQPSHFYPESAPDLRLASQQLAGAKDFVLLWQDYLAARNRDDRLRAYGLLEKMAALKSDGGIPIPRSKLMELLDSQSISDDKAVQLVEKIQSLDEIHDVLIQLDKPAETQNPPRVTHQLNQALSGIEINYRNFLNGMPMSLESLGYGMNSAGGKTEQKIWQLKGMLMKLALPRYLNAPPETVAKADEDYSSFADRLVEEAKGRGDILMAYRAREAKSLLNQTGRISPADTAGVTAYLAGKSQEEAGQYLLAAFSYQQALNSGSDLTPSKLIGERLEAIKTGHPDDYLHGTDRFLQSIEPRPGKK